MNVDTLETEHQVAMEAYLEDYLTEVDYTAWIDAIWESAKVQGLDHDLAVRLAG